MLCPSVCVCVCVYMCVRVRAYVCCFKPSWCPSISSSLESAIEKNVVRLPEICDCNALMQVRLPEMFTMLDVSHMIAVCLPQM